MSKESKTKIIVIGNGMVGHRFCERMAELDTDKKFHLTVFGEERLIAYDRVKLSSWFETRSEEKLLLSNTDWYKEQGFELLLNTKVTEIRPEEKTVIDEGGRSHPYDKLILATGSSAFVPPIEGIDKEGVFVYRTIDDLEAITKYANKAKSAAVIGGGLLGLEAAKACMDLELASHVVEFAPRLMPRQLDDSGSDFLCEKLEALGLRIHTATATKEILGNGRVNGMLFMKAGADAPEVVPIDMIVVSAGIRPRDELAREGGLTVGERGGIEVNEKLETSNSDIFAIGECALYEGMIYGLVAPGYEMANVVVKNLLGESAEFRGADMSTKLKLIGVDVASFGDAFAETPGARSVVYQNASEGVYKKLIVSEDGRLLLGGILVGDASDYGNLMQMVDNQIVLPPQLDALFFKGGAGFEIELPDSAQICKCNDVSKGRLVEAITEEGCLDAASLKACTNAGTECGGCLPLMNEILTKTLKEQGIEQKKDLCEHFSYSRQELFEIIKIKKIKDFSHAMKEAGNGGQGCEICKPTVASILASLWDECVAEDKLHTLQDTNDRFMANIQKGGSYSVVPRVPGGEITPEQLIRIGSVAKKYNLYTKITGGQRIDLFGARVEQLPDIWEELIEVGLESGQAYGKSLRTVKSCVGSKWCRFGVQDSTSMAIRLEKRYRGLRSPHKLKSAVSGCIRECAEAQSKDFGVIATEKGWNLYICGNGGARPQHAVLFASDLDDETLIRYIDRFLMYYISTADKLERTAWWFNRLEGGIEGLRKVLIEDSLGICSELEAMMERHVKGYECEWTAVVKDPEKRMRFRHFANSDEPDDSIRFTELRGQPVPEFPQEEAAKTV